MLEINQNWVTLDFPDITLWRAALRSAGIKVEDFPDWQIRHIRSVYEKTQDGYERFIELS